MLDGGGGEQGLTCLSSMLHHGDEQRERLTPSPSLDAPPTATAGTVPFCGTSLHLEFGESQGGKSQASYEIH